MTLVALNWAVLEFTGSALYVGLINACRMVPVFLLSVPAGVLADRSDPRKLLILLQAGIMLPTFCVGYLVAADSPFWLLAVVVTLRSVLMAVVTPVRNSLIPNLVPESQVASAVAIDSAVRNLSRIVGPAIAGTLLAVMGVADVFWISACSIVAVLLSLFVVHPESNRDAVSNNIKADIQEAAVYVKNSPSVQSLLILAVVPMVFGFPYTAMMPLFANDLLQLGPEGLGILLSVAAAGALVGSAWLSLGSETEGAGKWLVCSTIGFGLFLLLFMIAQTLVTAAVMMFLVGLASSTYRTMSRVTLQTRVPDRLRGRILSIALMDRELTNAAGSDPDRRRRRMGRRPVGRRGHGGRLALPSRWRCSPPDERSGACRSRRSPSLENPLANLAIKSGFTRTLWRGLHVDLSGANLSGADLSGVDLRNDTSLTQEQIDEAKGNERTQLPEGLQRSANWG